MPSAANTAPSPSPLEGEDRGEGGRPEGNASRIKPAAGRLYGRTKGNTLRPRQQLLLEATLPRLLLPSYHASDPARAFPVPPTELWLEVGFGGGEHARAQAAAHPQCGLIACEVYENGICSLLSALVPEGGERDAPVPPNLLIWPDDARLLLRQLPPASLSRLFLLFPDPWPKSRHAKRRFVHPDNTALVARTLQPGAQWRIATDDPTYQAWTAEVLSHQRWFAAAPPATTRPPAWPPTRYAQKAAKAGRPALYWTAIRTDAPAG